MTLKIRRNPNKELFDELTAAIEENNGECPCGIDESTICMCDDFKNMDSEGMCHCQRFIKVDE